MSDAYFQTTSNIVPVTDPQEVRAIIDDYQLRPECVTEIFNGSEMHIHTPEMLHQGFHVHRVTPDKILQQEVTTQMYARLAEYLEYPLKVRTIQTEGVADSDVTVTVHPEGEIIRTDNNTGTTRTLDPTPTPPNNK